MGKWIELRRHTDNDGDVLSADGVEAALQIGRSLAGGYWLFVSTGAQRATQTLACFACAMGEPVPGGVVVEPALRSEREDRWREVYREAGSGELAAMRDAARDFVEEDAGALADGLRGILDRLAEGQRALAVGHSPTNEAAVYGLTGEIVPAIAKGDGVVIAAEGGSFEVEPL